jgi:hypothetical protein
MILAFLISMFFANKGATGKRLIIYAAIKFEKLPVIIPIMGE